MILIAAFISVGLLFLWVIYFGDLLKKLTVNNLGVCFPQQGVTPYIFVFLAINLLFVNLNQIVKADSIFFLFSALSLVLFPKFYTAIFKERGSLLQKDLIDVLLVQLFLLVFVYWLFDIGKFWLLEGPNHDSLVYFEGLNWALNYPLQVSKEFIESVWGFNICSGGMYIGYDCPIYRGGSYTLVAWTQFFIPSKTAGGVWLSGALFGSFIWFTVHLVAEAVGFNLRLNRKIAFLIVVLVSISTAFQGALVNSNLATLFGAACIALAFGFIFTENYKLKSVTLGLLIGLSSHFYGEAMFYVGFLVLFSLIKDSFNNRDGLKEKVKKFIYNSFVVFIVFIAASNYTAYQAVYSLFFFSEALAFDQPWGSWFIHGPSWYWIGSFLAGDLQGHWVISKPSVVYASVLALAISVIFLFRRNKTAIFALTLLSFLAILLIELKGYQYGEHKIIQLLGPSWAVFWAAAVLSLISIAGDGEIKCRSRYYTLAILVTALTTYVSIDYLYRAKQLLQSLESQHVIKYGDDKITTGISVGDVVALDDSAFSIGVEPFFKSHYAAVFIHLKGGRVVLPAITDGPLRGGYYRNTLNDTLKAVKAVDFVLKGKGAAGTRSVFQYDTAPISSSSSYELIDVRRSGAALMTHGWYGCEIDRCWTKNGFGIEAFGNKKVSIELRLEYFSPPENGYTRVVIDGLVTSQHSVLKNNILLELDQGFHTIDFYPSWAIKSPSDTGAFNDTRKLFAAIKSVVVTEL
jgi:hypothetical protein